MSEASLSTQWRADYPQAKVSVDAQIGDSVSIGPGTIVHEHVEIGDASVIGENCVLGHRGPGEVSRLVIGAGSVIRSHSVLYAASRFGERLETGHHVVVRERTVAGTNLRIGNFCDIEGDCSFGDYCRLHGYAHVGKGSSIGDFVWLFSLTTLTNDPLPPSGLASPVTIEDGAVICVGVTLLPGTVIRKGAFLSAGAMGQGEIPAGAVVAGPEGRVVGHVSGLMHFASGTRHPWMRHFDRGLPPAAQERLRQLFKEVQGTRAALSLG